MEEKPKLINILYDALFQVNTPYKKLVGNLVGYTQDESATNTELCTWFAKRKT